MAKESKRMPMSSAGITTYYEEYKSKIEIKPQHVIVFAILVMIVIIALHVLGAGWIA
jgi:preprotein translocase subunit Sec61beta